MTLNVLLLLGVTLAWAAGYLFIGAAAHGAPPVMATAAMTWVGAAVMVPGVGLVLRRDLWGLVRRRPWVPVGMGLTALALPNLATVVGEETVHPDLASVLGTTVPIATVLLATFVTREETLSWVRLLGIAVALVGLVVFVGVRDVALAGSELHGIFVQMAGGLVFAVNGIWVARQTDDLDECALATWTMVFAAVTLTVVAFAVEDPTTVVWTPGLLRSLIAEGVVGMGLASLGYYVLVSRAGASFASYYAFLVPPLGVILAALAEGDEISARHAAGVSIVLVGLALLRLHRTAPVRTTAASS
jgi:drug/metabolite transporter (DMT)-like permease